MIRATGLLAIIIVSGIFAGKINFIIIIFSPHQKCCVDNFPPVKYKNRQSLT